MMHKLVRCCHCGRELQGVMPHRCAGGFRKHFRKKLGPHFEKNPGLILTQHEVIQILEGRQAGTYRQFFGNAD